MKYESENPQVFLHTYSNIQSTDQDLCVSPSVSHGFLQTQYNTRKIKVPQYNTHKK